MKNGNRKVYVQVDVIFTAEGHMRPNFITWEDGNSYGIERVRAVRPVYAVGAGSIGDRYTVIVEGREKYLYFERNTRYDSKTIGRWFVEKREGA